jgi:hypothetical protein
MVLVLVYKWYDKKHAQSDEEGDLFRTFHISASSLLNLCLLAQNEENDEKQECNNVSVGR